MSRIGQTMFINAVAVAAAYGHDAGVGATDALAEYTTVESGWYNPIVCLQYGVPCGQQIDGAYYKWLTTATDPSDCPALLMADSQCANDIFSWDANGATGKCMCYFDQTWQVLSRQLSGIAKQPSTTGENGIFQDFQTYSKPSVFVTAEPTSHPTASAPPTQDPTPSPTSDPTQTPSPLPTPAPKQTPTPSPTPASTQTPTPSPTPNSTQTPSPTATSKSSNSRRKKDKRSRSAALITASVGSAVLLGIGIVIAKRQKGVPVQRYFRMM